MILKEIGTKCPRCGSTETVTVSEKNYQAWKTGGMLIQVAFPNLTNSQRERLITGFCDECWDAIFKG